MAGKKVLIVDDEKSLLDVLAPFLKRAGFLVETALDGDTALARTMEFDPDVIVLDILIPEPDGREVCRRLRALGNWTPIIMLTQIGGSQERAMSLEEGADDYLNKPFDPGELVARIHALLRRAQQIQFSLASAHRLASGPLVIDRLSRRAWLNECELVLSAKAFLVLEYLMCHPDEVITRERLLDTVWGWDYPTTTRTVDVRIAELRKQLKDDPNAPCFIETLIGVGYRFVRSVKVQA
ncbi:MAG: DNA-binding response regulator [Thermoflexus sp.]